MVQRKNAPCKGCTDRWVQDGKSCHAECEKYKEYRDTLYEIYDERKRNRDVSEYVSYRCTKINKRINFKRR